MGLTKTWLVTSRRKQNVVLGSDYTSLFYDLQICDKAHQRAIWWARTSTKRFRIYISLLCDALQSTGSLVKLQNNLSVPPKPEGIAARGSLNLNKPASLSRSYASNSKDDGGPTETSHSSYEHPPPIPEMYLTALEQAAYAPWIVQEHTATDKSSLEDKLSRAYIRTFNIFMFLGRPQDEQAALAFLTVSFYARPKFYTSAAPKNLYIRRFKQPL